MVWTGATLPFTPTSFVYGIREYHRHTETNMTSSIIWGQFQFIQFPFRHVITHMQEPKIIKFHFSNREKVTVQDFMSNLFQFSPSTWHWVPRRPQYFTEWLAQLDMWEVHGSKFFPGIGSPSQVYCSLPWLLQYHKSLTTTFLHNHYSSQFQPSCQRVLYNRQCTHTIWMVNPSENLG